MVVIGYGLSGRLLPGLVELQASASAGGRLEQPLSYWNAMGALAAIGLVLCARLAGDHACPRHCDASRGSRGAGRARPVPELLSRGAGRGAVGSVLVALLVPTRAQWKACLLVSVPAVLAATWRQPAWRGGVAAGLAGRGPVAGAVMLVALVALVCVAAALAARRLIAARRRSTCGDRALATAGCGRGGGGGRPRGADGRRGGHGARRGTPRGRTARRLGDVGSNRYQYWKVAVREAADHPLKGIGAARSSTAWTRERKVTESARDAHSLALETAAELGLVGLAALAALLAGVAWRWPSCTGARPRWRSGPVTALVTWFVHANLDWDWEMPAADAGGVVLAGAALGAPRDVSAASAGLSRRARSRARRISARAAPAASAADRTSQVR